MTAALYQEDEKSNGSSSASIEPNDSTETTVAPKSSETATEPLAELDRAIAVAMEDELKKLEKPPQKRSPNCQLDHLNIVKCECRRNKKFGDSFIQTDAIPAQGAAVQCDSVETVESALKDNARKLKSVLSIHEISESEIIQIEYISSSVAAGKIV